MVFHPWDGLAFGISGCVAHDYAGAHVGSMNTAARRAAADRHHEHGFSGRVRLVILELRDDAEFRAAVPVAGMTLFAGIDRRREAAALQT